MPHNPYTKLARQAIELFLTNDKKTTPKNLPKDLTDHKSGVFVTIETKDTKKLLGCIGTYLPTKDSVAQEIIDNAIAAATQDYRFEPVKPTDLQNISITVSLLDEPEQIKNLNDLDPQKFGVIVKNSTGQTGLLLPDIKDVTTADKQVAIAAQKGGIDLATDTVYLYRFTVQKFSE